MIEKTRIYYYFIFGAAGGVTGWFLAAVLLRSGEVILSLTEQVIYGALLGAAVGLAIAAYDGITSYSFKRFVKHGSIGLLLGMAAGALALPVAQWSYAMLLTRDVGADAQLRSSLKSLSVGTLCWVLFGGIIGFGEGISKGTQSIKGLLGGLLGGLIGGITYEAARASGTTTDSTQAQLFLSISMAILGGAIGAAIAFVTTALKRAWIEVVDGKRAGKIIDVTKYVDKNLGSRKPGIIGSDEWSSNVYLPGDKTILPRHAQINFSNGAPTLTVIADAQKAATFINNRRITSAPLTNGDRLKIGDTTLVYRQRK